MDKNHLTFNSNEKLTTGDGRSSTPYIFFFKYQLSIENHPQVGATFPQNRSSLSQPNSLPRPTSFLTVIPILQLSYPQPMKPKEFGTPSLNTIPWAFILPYKALAQGWIGISIVGDSGDASFPKKTNKTTHCSMETYHT